MEKKVINLHQYMTTNHIESKRAINSGASSNDINSPTTFPNGKFGNYISYEALVAFIIDYGIKVLENESESYSKFMSEYHKSIVFYGITYYIPFYNFSHKEQMLYNYLIEEYGLLKTN